MDEITYRILDTLTRTLGRPWSIQGLAGQIRQRHGTAYYANVYRAVQALQQEGILKLDPLGKAYAVSLEFGSYALIDYLTEVEIRRKREVMAGAKRAAALFAALEASLRPLRAEFALCADPARNLRLNRLELLLAARGPRIGPILQGMADLSRRLDVRIDSLVLPERELLAFLAMDAANPVPEMLGQGMAFHRPQAFWATLAEAAVRGGRLRASDPFDLARATRGALTFNLARFGFPLLGAGDAGPLLCLEYTAAAALMGKDRRFQQGAAELLRKRPFNARVLAFLASKYGIGLEVAQALEAAGEGPSVREMRALMLKPEAWVPGVKARERDPTRGARNAAQ